MTDGLKPDSNSFTGRGYLDEHEKPLWHIAWLSIEGRSQEIPMVLRKLDAKALRELSHLIERLHSIELPKALKQLGLKASISTRDSFWGGAVTQFLETELLRRKRYAAS